MNLQYWAIRAKLALVKVKRVFYDGKLKRLRFRNVILVWGSVAVASLLVATDPDSDRITTLFMGLGLISNLLAVLMAHICRKALLDYEEADLRILFREARAGKVSAGLACIAVSIFFVGLLWVFGSFFNNAQAADVRTYIPVNANIYLPVLIEEQKKHWPRHPNPAVLAALIEHESCVTLTSKRCWSPTSQLKTAREEGAGFGQITRAYRPDGTLRFDALSEMRSQHPALKEWSWENVYQRPDLQLAAVVLKTKQDFIQILRLVSDRIQALIMTDAAYNGGRRGVMNERRACGLREGCNPDIWFGHVELVCLKSKTPIYSGRSACDINRHHVRDVFLVRTPKYEKLLKI
jgi:hypothetical protein